MYITDKFSIEMLQGDHSTVGVQRLQLRGAISVIDGDPVSLINNPEVAYLAGKELTGKPLGYKLASGVKLDATESVLVVRYIGPELQEETTILPEGGELQYWLVTVLDEDERKN